MPSQGTKDPTCLVVWLNQKGGEKKDKFLLDKYTILGTGDTVVSKRDTGPALRELII